MNIIIRFICVTFCFYILSLAIPHGVHADTIYWEDNFHRADGSVANGWASPNGASGQIISNVLRRTDFGYFRCLYNTTGKTLPADYYVTVTVPQETVDRNYWGVIGRYLPSGGNGTGLKVFWNAGGANLFGAGHGDYDNDIAITVTGGLPPSWSANGNHTVTMGFVGTKVTIYLDGQEYGFFVDETNNQPGTSVGLVGDGGGTMYDVQRIQVTDYLPDTPPYTLSTPSSSPASTTATISWQTAGYPSDSLVEYGTSAMYGSSVADTSLVTSHSVILTGLLPNTIYHYRVISNNIPNGTVTSLDYTFLTSSAIGTVYWEDNFHRADGAIGNGWDSVDGASGQIVNNTLHRTDSGNYRILYNPIGGMLPADYYVTMTVPHSILSTSCWGLIGRYLYSDGTGLKVFWIVQGNLGVGHSSYGNDIAATVTGGYPASWSQNQDHLITLGFTGNTVTVYLDGNEYGYFTDSTNKQLGTGIGFVGNGVSGAYDVLDVKVTDYIPGGGAAGISNVASSTAETTAFISWRTNETTANSSVEYGTTTDYGSTSSSAVMVTSHSVTLVALTPNTLYHYRVLSQDVQGHIMTSQDYTFITEHHIYPDELTFQTNGASFAANITVENGATILWTFEDGTTSNSATPTKDYSSTGNRVNRLKVIPWSALKIVNIGYDGGDGGIADTPYLDQQNVTYVYGMNNIAPYLEQWASSHNPLTSLDFSNFVSLKIIECFMCLSMTSVNLHNTPLLSRADFEHNNLSSLDFSESPSLADLRGGNNNYPTITWGSTGAHIWHICIHDNPQMTSNIPNLDSQFPLLRELLIWNTNQNGTLHPTSTNLTTVIAYNNHYTAANFSGDFPGGTFGAIDLSNNNLTSLDISDDPGLFFLNASNNALNQAAINGALQTLNSFGTRNGAVDLRSNAIPSTDGITSAASLRNRGWTVNLDADNTSPTVTAFTIPASSNTRIVPITTFSATDNSGVTGYLVSESGTAPLSNDPAWSAYAPMTYTFTTAGSKTIFAWAKDAAGNVSRSVSASVTITLETLSVSFTGGDDGRVTSIPPGIDCKSDPCSATFDIGTTITLTAVPDTGAIFSSWGGVCASMDGKCRITINDNKNARITFSHVQPVRLLGSSTPFILIGDAYADLANGGTIQSREYEFSENLDFNRDIKATLKGGYDTGFSGNNGLTTVSGRITFSIGSVNVENIVIK